LNSIETAVQEVKEGKVKYFEIIVDQFQYQLFRYCYRMLGNVHESQDVVQEAFLKAFDKINSYNEAISFSAWLYKIAYNHCINIIRRRKLLQFVSFLDATIPDTMDVGKNLEEIEINKELNNVLKKLSTEDRCIVILKNIEEKSFEEIALILSIKPVTIRKRYERLRKKLRVSFSQTEGGIVNENYSING
jgi:RNA polymerase sigma-70 factor, ECF subfamily